MSNQAIRMTFNHISFPSIDVPATAGFFEKHLGCTSSAFGASRILKRAGFDIVIEDASARAVAWPQNFHIGFEVPTLEDVRRLYENFLLEGVEIEGEVIAHARGSRFFCRVPGGLLVEINTRADAHEEYRASFAAS